MITVWSLSILSKGHSENKDELRESGPRRIHLSHRQERGVKHSQEKGYPQLLPHLIDQPITYKLIKDYDLMINILRARITLKEQGI